MQNTIHLLQEARIYKKISFGDTTRQRRPFDELDKRNQQAVVVIGERGLGKTTWVLQYLETQQDTFYFSADSPLVTDLYRLVHELVVTYGKRCIVIDEIHQGADWKKHLKALIDAFPQLHLIVLGSSSLDLYQGTAALARRTRHIYFSTVSFREYCKYLHGVELPVYTIDDLLAETPILAWYDRKFGGWFDIYMQKGAYPYMKDTTVDYFDVLRRNMQKTILDDIPTFLKMKTDTLSKLEKMFYFIAKTPPSDFTYTGLSQKIGLSKDVLESIMVYLHKIGVVNLLIRSNKLSDIMRKEFKVLLGNPNMYYAYGVHKDKGALRESFVIHSLRKIQQQQILPDYMTLPSYGDIAFKWQDKYYTFEIGGRSKGRKQIEGVANSFVVTDEMIPSASRIPLWMFGLLE